LKKLPKIARTQKPTELRSRIMRAIRSMGTKPETTVAAWLRGARFKPVLNDRSLPGSPDFVLPRAGVAIFVHGCFWHGHRCKRGRREPASNVEYWTNKLAANRKRDASSRRKLQRLGWRVVTVWECQTHAGARRDWLLKTLRR
jgi:DNA mismatch endonuclease, patch repair protein